MLVYIAIHLYSYDKNDMQMRTYFHVHVNMFKIPTEEVIIEPSVRSLPENISTYKNNQGLIFSRKSDANLLSNVVLALAREDLIKQWSKKDNLHKKIYCNTERVVLNFPVRTIAKY